MFSISFFVLGCQYITMNILVYTWLRRLELEKIDSLHGTALQQNYNEIWFQLCMHDQ
jgi:hypothetical protein